MFSFKETYALSISYFLIAILLVGASAPEVFAVYVMKSKSEFLVLQKSSIDGMNDLSELKKHLNDLKLYISDEEREERILHQKYEETKSSLYKEAYNTHYSNKVSLSNTASLILKQIAKREAELLEISFENLSNGFVKAAQNGEIDNIRKYLKDGVDINSVDQNGWSALHWAAQNGQLPLISVLLNNGADVNARNARGETPLMEAAYFNNTKVISLLLEKGARTHLVDSRSSGKTALWFAAMCGREPSVKLLLSHGAELGSQPLPIESQKLIKKLQSELRLEQATENERRAEKLRRATIEIEHQRKVEEQAKLDKRFIKAVQQGDLHEVEELLDLGATPNSFMNTDLSFSSPFNSYGIAHRNSHSSSTSALHVAMDNNNYPLASLCLQKAGRHYHPLPLDAAANRGLLNFVSLFLENGADVNARSTSLNEGSTVLINAICAVSPDLDNFPVISLLIEKGAQLNVADTDGHTALWHAASRRQGKVVKLLISKGAIILNPLSPSNAEIIDFIEYEKKGRVAKAVSDVSNSEYLNDPVTFGAYTAACCGASYAAFIVCGLCSLFLR